MERSLNELMQRKEELLRIKKEIERSKTQTDIKPENCSQRVITATMIKSSNNEEPSDNGKLDLRQKSESTENSKDCSHRVIADNVDVIEDSDTEVQKFDVTSSFLTQKHHHSGDTTDSLDSSTTAKGISDLQNSSFQLHDTSKTIQQKSIIVNNSSDSSDVLNTSTICLEMTHSFFNDSNNINSLPIIEIGNSKTPEPPKKRAKINIVSVEKIDDLNAKRLNAMTYFELHSKISSEYYDKDALTTIPQENVSKYSLEVDKVITCNRTEELNGGNTQISELETLDLPIFSGTNIKPLAISVTPCGNVMTLESFESPIDIAALNLPGCHSADIMVSDSPGSPSIDIMAINLPKSPSTNIAPLNNSDEGVNKKDLMVKKSRKRKCQEKYQNFKKEHVDFMSDDELLVRFAETEDFSTGSSELWSGKESDKSTDSTNALELKKTKKKRKKLLQKKRKSDEKGKEDIQFKKTKLINKRKNRKTKRDKGMSYETSSGKQIEARKLQPNPCEVGKCPRNCFDIPDERRQNIFDFYWNLDNQRKKDWLVQCASRLPVNRPKKDLIENKRNFTFAYYINEGEGRRQVCQKFVLKTLDISQNFLLYTLSNANEGLSQVEKRIRSTMPKYDENVIASAKRYIEALPFLPSHYCRKQSNKLYLPQEYKSTTNLYRLYRKYCEDKQESYLGERKFIDLFRKDYDNVNIHIPKKDKCKICTKIENNRKESEAEVDSVYKAHIEEKEVTYERFQCHQNLHLQVKDTIVSSFDLQKVLNTPHGDNILLYYSRKYTVFNFTIYESTTQNGFCYTWGECDGKRGAKEIGSCIYKYLQDVDDRGIKKVIFYCDCCSGQNRNKTILSIFQYFLAISKNIEVIQINYLLPGHSYMPVDSMHAVIEREVRKFVVWSPTQWSSYMESARKNPRPYKVFDLEFNDFIDWDPVTKECFSPSTNLQMSKIRIATMKKKDLKTITTKHSMKTDATSYKIETDKENVDQKRKGKCEGKGKGTGKGKGKGKKKTTPAVDQPSTLNADTELFETRMQSLELKHLYKKRLPISQAKYKDLKKLCNDGIIPNRFHNDFLKLPHASHVNDTLNQTDEEDSVQEED